MKEGFIEMLRQFFDNKGIGQTKIAEMLGVDPAYINKLLNGKKAFGKKTAQKFQDLFGLSASWLLTGEGSMLVSDEPQPSVNTGDHSSTAVGAGSTAIHGADAEKYLEIIREQQKSITKLIDTITSNLSKISDSVSGLSDSVSDISSSVSDLSNSVGKLSDPSKTQ